MVRRGLGKKDQPQFDGNCLKFVFDELQYSTQYSFFLPWYLKKNFVTILGSQYVRSKVIIDALWEQFQYHILYIAVFPHCHTFSLFADFYDVIFRSTAGSRLVAGQRFPHNDTDNGESTCRPSRSRLFVWRVGYDVKLVPERPPGGVGVFDVSGNRNRQKSTVAFRR